MRREDVQYKLEVVPENVAKLELLRSKTRQQFRSDFRNLDSALHRLQTSVQALIDLGSYIIAELGLRTPSTSGEVIEILVDAEFVDREDSDRYIAMVQFRNRVVHLYNQIDSDTVYEIMGDSLDDIRTLYRTLLEIIGRHEEE